MKGLNRKKYSVQFFIVALLGFVCFSCNQQEFHRSEDLITHILDPESGYTKSTNVNGVNYVITYKPTDMMVAQEIFDNTTPAGIDSLRIKYKDFMYFNISIHKNGKEVLNSMGQSREQFGAMVNQLAFGMGKAVNLVTQKKDTIEHLDYIYPRVYGMGGTTDILFIYPRDPKLLSNEKFKLTIEDFGLKTGEVAFHFDTKSILKEPLLDFSEFN
ncbi:hypothetical protein PP182_19840 [Maribacter sp. PR1]|uniref:DUF4840 domain-containing protein n=1 Tax=Maribacter cobaltidurans TaxID=1178778 RepID=A0ABU7IZB5_9FLAO|nr:MULTISPECIES: hypothetical protein [Maribacter]MDC6390948.1 hypothetical protein [Maribacter sp. PR1]MEE1978340.1 hypothetical protein [Maribacter cobaltidurans]